MNRINPAQAGPPIHDGTPNIWTQLGLQFGDPVQQSQEKLHRDHATWVKTKIESFLSGTLDEFPIGAFPDFRAMVENARMTLNTIRVFREDLERAEVRILSERDQALAAGDAETASAKESEWSRFSTQYAPFVREEVFPGLPEVSGIGEIKAYLDERLRTFTPWAMGLQVKLAEAIASIRETTDCPPIEVVHASARLGLADNPLGEATVREIWPELFSMTASQPRQRRSVAGNRKLVPAAVWVGLAVFAAMALMGLVIGLVGR